MSQYCLLAIALVPVGMVGGILALSIRHLPVDRGGAEGLCFIAGVSIVQGWTVLSGIFDASRTLHDLRAACSLGAKARFKSVFLIGVGVLAGSIPMAVLGEPSQAQAHFATVAIGGVIFSTAGALITLPAVMLWIGG
jgi:cobalt-zinc-cadmium resistance protein CzcA